MGSGSQNRLEVHSDICRKSERSSQKRRQSLQSASPRYSPHSAEVKAACNHSFCWQLNPMALTVYWTKEQWRPHSSGEGFRNQKWDQSFGWSKYSPLNYSTSTWWPLLPPELEQIALLRLSARWNSRGVVSLTFISLCACSQTLSAPQAGDQQKLTSIQESHAPFCRLTLGTCMMNGMADRIVCTDQDDRPICWSTSHVYCWCHPK